MFGQPQSDLSILYEEQVDESQSASFVYMKDKQRFWIDEVFPSSGLTGRGYQIVTGGYKLYGTSGAEDRWFFNFNIELPTSMFTNGTIIYQYLTYQDADQNIANTGAVACKI